MHFSNSLEILQNAQEHKVYAKLITQLKKDFALSNLSIQLETDTYPEQLKIVLKEKLYVLMMERFSEYLNLLYIVDVPEREFKQIQVTDVVEVADQVCFLILQRELQKVWLKEKYS